MLYGSLLTDRQVCMSLVWVCVWVWVWVRVWVRERLARGVAMAKRCIGCRMGTKLKHVSPLTE
jgi:hypothetical protein